MASAPLAGAVAGFAEVILVQPLDMVKTRFQIYESGQNPSVPRALMDIYREGGFSRFYRGFIPEAASTMPARTAMYWTYDSVNSFLSDRWGGPSAAAAHIAGFSAGPAEAVVVTPMQVVKVRLQSREYLGRYANTVDCCKQVLHEEGVRALFAGVGATTGRNAVWNGMYFGIIFRLRGLVQRGDEGPFLRAVGTSGMSFAAGAIATCFNAPFDVAKSRIQLQDTRSEQRKYRSTVQTLGTILREEGPKAVYKGFAPKVLRMAMGGAIGMPIFEACKAVFDRA